MYRNCLPLINLTVYVIVDLCFFFNRFFIGILFNDNKLTIFSRILTITCVQVQHRHILSKSVEEHVFVKSTSILKKLFGYKIAIKHFRVICVHPELQSFHQILTVGLQSFYGIKNTTNLVHTCISKVFWLPPVNKHLDHFVIWCWLVGWRAMANLDRLTQWHESSFLIPLYTATVYKERREIKLFNEWRDDRFGGNCWQVCVLQPFQSLSPKFSQDRDFFFLLLKFYVVTTKYLNTTISIIYGFKK